MRFLFDLFYLLAGVLLAPWLAWRAVRTGRYRQHLLAKLFGHVATSPAGVRTVWFHGVSVGEIHLLVTLVAAFRKRHPDWRVVVSSTTDTGLEEATAKFPDLTVIAYPFDFSWACGEALDRVRPAVLVLAESELWPNFLAAAGERNIPVVVANARISPRTFGRMKRVKSILQRVLFRHVTAFAVQTDEYAGRLRQLGVSESRLVVTGSVKYDGATGDRDTAKGRELGRLLGLIPLAPGGEGNNHPRRRIDPRPGRSHPPRRVRQTPGDVPATAADPRPAAQGPVRRSRGTGATLRPAVRPPVTALVPHRRAGGAPRHRRRTRGRVGPRRPRVHRRQPGRQAGRAEHDRAGRVRRAGGVRPARVELPRRRPHAGGRRRRGHGGVGRRTGRGVRRAASGRGPAAANGRRGPPAGGGATRRDRADAGGD